jgi:hypothetical protein
MNNNGYLIYQAERPLSRTELRAVDTARGEVARGLSRLFHSRHTEPGHQAACLRAEVTVPDYPPAEWVQGTPAECR